MSAKVFKFTKPMPQSVLNDQLGLTTQDIADSLGIGVGNVRQKLTSRGMLDRLKSLNLKIFTIANFNSNGVAYDDYVLDVNAAKFFIAKYENKRGDAYLKYLVDVESDAQAEGLTSHVDPTNLTDTILDPRHLAYMLNTLADARDAEKARADKAEETIITNKHTASVFAMENLKSMSAWIREFPILYKKGLELQVKTRSSLTPAACLTMWAKGVLGVEPLQRKVKKKKYAACQYDRATILKLIKIIEGEGGSKSITSP